MAANVETMFYVRETPWHGLGTKVDEALSSAEALKKAGLDWAVIPKPLFTEDGMEAEGFVANVRSSDNKVLGVVSDRYRICQNTEAFDFTDALIGEGVKYETAGSLANGKKVWMLAKMPGSHKILGDDFDPYLVFSNCHDGTGAIRVAVTPIRVVCQNTLNVALKTAKRAWSTCHKGNLESKMEEAYMTLTMAKTYMERLAEEAETLAQFQLSRGMIEEILEAMFPVSEEKTDRVKNNKEQAKSEILTLLDAHDIQKFGKNNAWSFMNAVSDWAGHRTPLRKTATYNEMNFAKTIEGHPVLDQAKILVDSFMKVA